LSKVKKALVKSRAGVRLERIERPEANHSPNICFLLSSHRSTPTRIIAEEIEAWRAFEREVAASLLDPVVVDLIEKGMLDR
jgi:hypothetical protein